MPADKPVHFGVHIAASTNQPNPPHPPTNAPASRADDTHVPNVRARQPRPSTPIPLLSPHQWSILDLLDSEPLLATGHISALLFTQGTPLSRERICRRELRQLADWGLSYRERPVPARPGGGSEQALHSITAAGRRTLALRDGRAPTRATRPQERGQATRQHLLAIADLHVQIALAARKRRLEMRWTAEPACWWRFTHRHQPELLKPDAYVEVDHPTEIRMAWIEIDRGTQSAHHPSQSPPLLPRRPRLPRRTPTRSADHVRRRPRGPPTTDQ